MILKSTIGIVSPVEDQNYVLNPSAEIAGNFTDTGGATINRVTTFQKYGLYSYEVITAGGGEGIELSLLTLPSIDVYVTFRAANVGNAEFDINLGGAARVAPLLEKIDSQWGLYGAFFPASVAGGEIVVEIEKTNAGANTFYVDGVQVSQLIEGRYHSTYLDGSQDGCRWLGTPNASASTRSGDSRAGGVVRSFWEGYGFFPEKALGMGTAVEELNIDSYAFLPGGELNSSKIPPREFTIIGYFLGDTVEELHEQAQALELELGLNTYPGRQPVRLRYFGAKVQKEISANYAGGLEGDLPIFYNDDNSVEDEHWTKNFKFKMRASIQFVALDPFWYEVGESATLLDTNDTTTFRTIAGRLESIQQWSSLGPPNAAGTYTAVYALAEDDIYIYIGGDFLNFDNIANADYIVRREKSTGTYSAMAALNGPVLAITIAPNGDVIIGGFFTNASGVADADLIAVWEVGASAFTALGGATASGVPAPSVAALKYDNSGNLIIGGTFINWNGIADADNIVLWDGSAYAAMGAGKNDTIRSIDIYANVIYIGGEFAEGLAYFDGSAWVDIVTGIDFNIFAIKFDPTGLLYLGGNFTTPHNNIMTYRNGVFSALGTGVDAAVYAIGIGPDGSIILSGALGQAGDLFITDAIARWNGYSFSHLGLDLPDAPTGYALLVSQIADPLVPSNYDIYLGFDTSGDGAFAGLETAQNSGTISAFPKIVFYRSGGDEAIIQTLRNERTGRELLFNYGLLDGESLTIDLNPKNRTITSSFFGSRMNARLANDDFSVWQLLPGENPVSSFVSEDGSPDVVAYVLFREPYKSWN